MNLAPYLRAFGIGAVCGMRTMTGPAATRLTAHDVSRYIMPVLALGEFVADKLPATPARTQPIGLIARSLAGGFAGGSVAAARGGERRIGALVGIAGAVAAAYVFMRLRREIVDRSGLPDPIVALGEDALAIGSGYLLANVG